MRDSSSAYPLTAWWGYFFTVMALHTRNLLSCGLPVWLAFSLILWGAGCAPAVRPFDARPSVASFVRMLSNEATGEGRTALARSWMDGISRIPWPPYEDGHVHFFLWDEDHQRRTLPGLAVAAHAWLPRAAPFVRLGGTPLLYARLEADPLADFVYWISDGGGWYRDPHNPLTAPDPLQQRASRVDLAGRGRPAWASRPPFMPRGRLERTALGGSWFVRRPVWLYHSPASASNRLGWAQGEMSRPDRVDGVLVVGITPDPADHVLLANCLDRAFFGSSARMAVVCLETTQADAPVGGWGFAEIASREAVRLVVSSGGTNSGLCIGVAATGMDAAHLLHAMLRNGPMAQRVWCVAPRTERHGAMLEYALRQPLPEFPGVRLHLAGLDGGGDFWVRLRDGIRGRGARIESENPALAGLASGQPDVRRTALYSIVRDWLGE